MVLQHEAVVGLSSEDRNPSPEPDAEASDVLAVALTSPDPSAGISAEGDGSADAAAANTPEGAPVSLLAGDRAEAMPWSFEQWAEWSPGMQPTELPPLAVAAMADVVAAKGHPPSVIISELRAELAEKLAAGERVDATAEEAAISRLELELCHGPPRGVCVKCREAERCAAMVACGHSVLCIPCRAAVQAHIESCAGMNPLKLSRLMCPVCRGFEVDVTPDADRLFAIIDRNASQTIEPAELLIHLLVAGQEPETVAELFLNMDTDGDGRISIDEWRDGFEAFLEVAKDGPALALRKARPPPPGDDPRWAGEWPEEEDSSEDEESVRPVPRVGAAARPPSGPPAKLADGTPRTVMDMLVLPLGIPLCDVEIRLEVRTPRADEYG